MKSGFFKQGSYTISMHEKNWDPKCMSLHKGYKPNLM